MTVRIKGFAKLSGAWLIVGSVTAILVEVLLRLLAPMHVTGGDVSNFQYDEDLGYRLKSGYFSNVTDFKQEVFVNQLGTVNFVDDFSGYGQIIFALGDSYTQGSGLPMDSSYPMQLDLLLNTPSGRYEPDYLVANLGLAGYGGDQIVIVYERFREVIGQPDVILYLGCSNDRDDDQRFRNGYRHRHLVDGSPHWGIFQKPLVWLVHGTEIGKRFNYLRGRLATRGSKEASPAEDQSIAAPIAESQRASIEKLHRETIATDTLLIVGWANGPDDTADPGSYEWLKQWADENQVAFADWYPAVESVQRSLPALPATNDHSSGHHRSWVNAIIARAFARHIRAGTESTEE